jgi:hypothetical protein
MLSEQFKGVGRTIVAGSNMLQEETRREAKMNRRSDEGDEGTA